MIKPDACFDRITDISVDFLKKQKIKGLILDLDNTLIDYDGNFINGINRWIEGMKNNSIKICIATNSIDLNKISKCANMLDVPFVYKSFKPSKIGIKKAMKILKLNEKEIAEIGDQIFTDVWVSNRTGLYSILVKPIVEERSFINKIKRKIEKWYLAR